MANAALRLPDEGVDLSSWDVDSILRQQYGLVIGIDALSRLMGFRNIDAIRRAHERGLLPVRLFEIPQRRGRFALTEDVARWARSLRASPELSKEVAP